MTAGIRAGTPGVDRSRSSVHEERVGLLPVALSAALAVDAVAVTLTSTDPTVARGVPCAFRAYEVFRGGAWQKVQNGMPGKTDRIRAIESAQ